MRLITVRNVVECVLLQAVLASMDATFQHALCMAGSTLDVDNHWPAHATQHRLLNKIEMKEDCN